MPLRLSPTFRTALAEASRPLAGIWVCSGSPLVAEICAGSGMDWVLIDMEHSPNGLESVLTQLQAVAGYPVTPVVRVPIGDVVTIKQVLDLGAQNLLVPMVSSRTDAEAVVAAVRYPPRGSRGVGSALARSARWNRVDGYLRNADDHVSLFVQIETAAGVEAAAEIAAVDGIDGVFFGPADLSASMGHLGQPAHPEVLKAIDAGIATVLAAGKAPGIIDTDPAVSERYLKAGALFVAVGVEADLLIRAASELAARFKDK
jgi:4-hydroxy-2-oxoheptanedioate aldolase